jgi:hypothetical protein
MLRFQNLFSALRIVSVAASLLAAFALSGCERRSATSPADDAAARANTQTRPADAPEPEANVFVDEAMLAKPYAIIGGTVENVGDGRLEKLSVEIELKRRADGSVERREVSVEPGNLEPGRQGKFSLKVLSEEWSGYSVVKLRSAAPPQEVAFKSLPGAKRPPERFKDNVVIVKTPGPKKSGGGDFINTPDTPYKVP